MYDVIIIGGGTAGSNAARASLKAGAKKVLLVHSSKLLNTCVEEGCMPSKSIIHSSAEGMSFTDATTQMDGHIDQLLGGISGLLSKEGFEIMEGDAVFLPNDEGLQVTDGDGEKTVQGKSYVIATGSSSFVPPIDGLDTVSSDLILTSEHIVSHKHILKLPKSVFILGGGPIGLEMMTVFNNFGTNIIVAEMGEHLLSRMDPEFGLEMERAILKLENVTLLTKSKVVKVREANGEVVVSVEQNGEEKEYKAEKLLLATGRRPNLEKLELQNVGVVLQKGRPKFNVETLETDSPNVFIAGDATGTYQILHYASAMGKVAGHNAVVGKGDRKIDYELLSMGVIFSEPQIGNIGLTEIVAKEKGVDVVSSTLKLPNIGRGLLENQPVGLWKLTARKSDARIVGAQAVGPSPHSEWFIDMVAWLIYFKGTTHDLKKKQPYYHPTYPELLQSMGRELCSKLGEEEDDTICSN